MEETGALIRIFRYEDGGARLMRCPLTARGGELAERADAPAREHLRSLPNDEPRTSVSPLRIGHGGTRLSDVPDRADRVQSKSALRLGAL